MDILDEEAVVRTVTGLDAVVAAVKGDDRLVPRAANTLLRALPRAGIRRLVFLGGGGSLRSPSGQRYVDSPQFPAQYRGTALDQADALDILRASDANLDWSYLSPPPVHLFEGPKTGRYRTAAQDIPLTDHNGESRISVGDYASAVVDVVEGGSFCANGSPPPIERPWSTVD